MNRNTSTSDRLSLSKKRLASARSSMDRVIAEALEPRQLFSTFTVTSLSDASGAGGGSLTLRQAVAAANAAVGSDTINFSPTLFQSAMLQTITLSQGEIDLTDTTATTTITGPGASLLEIDGNSLSRVFGIDPNVTATIGDLTIANGIAGMGSDGRYEGGGIYNQGDLTLVDSTVTGNAAGTTQLAGAPFAPSRGGGINSSGTLIVQDSLFSSNTAYGVGYSLNSNLSDGLTGAGGAIYGTGPITITNSTLTDNSATGGEAGSGGTASGGEGIGGAVYATQSLEISNSTLSQNSAVGMNAGNNGDGGNAIGGAIFSATSTSLVSSSVTGNSAIAGPGSYGVNGAAYGGGIFATGSLTITTSNVSVDSATSGANTAPSAPSLEADGGGIYSGVNTTTGVGTLTLVQSTVSDNSAIGSDGDDADDAGSAARGGGIFAQAAMISASSITANSANGGNGTDASNNPHVPKAGDGGNALGAGMWLGQASTVTDSTVANNATTSGNGGGATEGTLGGDGGASAGAGIDTVAALQIFDSTVTGNTATAGAAGAGYVGTMPQYSSAPGNPGTATGGGLLVGSGACVVTNTIISADISATPLTNFDDISGTLQNTSANNLIGQGGGLINGVNGNQVGVNDPQLDALANNGGPTQTLFPQPGGPAIDAGSTALIPMGLTTDQRGLPRVPNGLVDMGAVQLQAAPAPTIIVTPTANQTATVNQSTSVSLGSFTEVDAAGPYMLDIKWGDGSPDTMLPLASASAISPITHAFASSGAITVSETVSDTLGTISNVATFSETVATGALPASMLAFTSAPTTAITGATIAPITVAVQDSTGATVTSDNSIVTLTLSGGATFSDGKTSETATASLGDATFDNLSVNSPGAYTLAATDGSLTAAQSSLTITPVVSLANSLVTVAQPTVAVGATDTITLQARDKIGNNILTALSVAFSLVSATGAGVGTIGPVAYAGNGTYTATFTAIAVGDPVQIAATIGGGAVTTAMPTITVTPPPLSPATSTISVSPLLLGQPATITLQAKDAAGDDLTTGGAVVVFNLTGATTTTLQATDNGNGTYTAAFTPGTAGVIHIGATTNGNAVTSSLSPVVSSLSVGVVLPSGFAYKSGRAVVVKLHNVGDTLAVDGPLTIQLALSASADGSNPIDIGKAAVVKANIRAGATVSGRPRLGGLPTGLDPAGTYYLVAQITAGRQSAGQGVSAAVITPPSIAANTHVPVRAKFGKSVNVPIHLINSGYSPITAGMIGTFFFSASSDGSNPIPIATTPAALPLNIAAGKTGGRSTKNTLHVRLLIPSNLMGVYLFATVPDAASNPLLVAVFNISS
jgi:hypothetical protein